MIFRASRARSTCRDSGDVRNDRTGGQTLSHWGRKSGVSADFLHIWCRILAGVSPPPAISSFHAHEISNALFHAVAIPNMCRRMWIHYMPNITRARQHRFQNSSMHSACGFQVMANKRRGMSRTREVPVRATYPDELPGHMCGQECFHVVVQSEEVDQTNVARTTALKHVRFSSCRHAAFHAELGKDNEVIRDQC